MLNKKQPHHDMQRWIIKHTDPTSLNGYRLGFCCLNVTITSLSDSTDRERSAPARDVPRDWVFPNRAEEISNTLHLIIIHLFLLV